ncbi:hypothetical protein NKDENANG_00376 [Candidatus Entotheonellaceae bacterium PAL068K]
MVSRASLPLDLRSYLYRIGCLGPCTEDCDIQVALFASANRFGIARWEAPGVRVGAAITRPISLQNPLVLHDHPLVIYCHKGIKQADIVLALFLLGDEFSLQEKQRNFEYYEPLTTGDSSLSICMKSIVAFAIGSLEKRSNTPMWRCSRLSGRGRQRP